MPKKKKNSPKSSSILMRSVPSTTGFFTLFIVVAIIFLMLNPSIVISGSVLGEKTDRAGEAGEKNEDHRGPDDKALDASSLPLRIQQADKKLLLKKEPEDGDEVEFMSRDFKRLETISSEDASGDGKLDSSKKHFGAKSHFPLSIDPGTNTLIVTTPAGIKAVAILPDIAVQNMLAKGILSKIGGGIASGSGRFNDGTATESGNEDEDLTSNIELKEKDGKLMYKIKGTVKKKIFGIIPIKLKREVNVSADDGEVDSVEEPIFTRILGIISF
jgi:hypothetical protein